MSKQTVLDEALKNIEKQFGKGAIMKLGSGNAGTINTFHSGSFQLDSILGGGFPEGRVVEIYGPESSGKTTIALQAIAEIQKRGEAAAFIDAEHALDPVYARSLGVNTEELLLAQPDYGEQALQIAEELAKTGAIKLIVIDSVAAMVPRAEVEGDMGDSHMGLQARMMSQGLRKLTSILAKTGTTIVFINQIRMKIGVMFGNPETTTGGNALKFYASQRLEIRKGEKIEANKEQIGYYAKVKVVKNKVAPPFKACTIPVLFSQGFDHTTDLIEAAILLEIIKKGGAFYSFSAGETKGKKGAAEPVMQKVQGKDALVKIINENDAMKAKLEHEVIMAIKDMRMGKKAVPLAPIDAADAAEVEVAEEVE